MNGWIEMVCFGEAGVIGTRPLLSLNTFKHISRVSVRDRSDCVREIDLKDVWKDLIPRQTLVVYDGCPAIVVVP